MSSSPVLRTVLIVALVSLLAAPFARADDKATMRADERKFAEFMGITDVIRKLDDGSYTPKNPRADPVPATLIFPPTPLGAIRTVPDIEAACGKSLHTWTSEADGYRCAFYGRLGYQTKDGKKVDAIWINLYGYGW